MKPKASFTTCPCPSCFEPSVALTDSAGLVPLKCYRCTITIAAIHDDKIERMELLRHAAKSFREQVAAIEHGRAISSTQGSREAVTELHRAKEGWVCCECGQEKCHEAGRH